MEEVRVARRKRFPLGWDRITVMTCDVDNYIQHLLSTYCMPINMLSLFYKNILFPLEIFRSEELKHRETESFAQCWAWTHSIGKILTPTAQFQSLLSQQYWMGHTERAEWWAAKQMRMDELSEWTVFHVSQTPQLLEKNKNQREGDIKDECFQDCTFILLSLGV